ncbi:MAG: peptide deformylase [Cytophagales bacterium]|nr:peptide deformylase [Cytophagales bacterium]MDW8383741.1 peptide deformylase [Flammeovirgaceae bacterium]
MIYPIIAYGDPILKKRAKPVEKDDSFDLKQLVSDMFDTMYQANGVGLAAPQIGLSIRVFVVDAEQMEEKSIKGFKKTFINPTILDESGDEWTYEEGCLSIPQVRAEVNRKSTVKIRYYDENWKEFTETYDGIAARIIQHEYDHLEGILFIDRISMFKRKLIQGKLNDILKGTVKHDYKMKFHSK